jgi:nicotinamidase-related amidase
MQKDFVDGSLGTPEAQAIVPLVAQTIKQFADPNTVCILTNDTHPINYMQTLEGKNLPVPHCIKGTAGHSIVDGVFEAYSCKDFRDPWEVYPVATTNPLRVEKCTFGSVELQNVLATMHENEEIEEITLMGLCTGICVLSNAILCKATLPEVPVNVVADCCACVTPESHKTALEAMKLCQINII